MKYENRQIGLAVWLLATALLVPLSRTAQAKPAERWTKKELKEAIASAKTPGDHTKIAQYYRIDAARSESEEKEHAAFAKKHGSRTGRHCRWLSAEYAKKAGKDRALAKIHENMAKSAAQQHWEYPIRQGNFKGRALMSSEKEER